MLIDREKVEYETNSNLWAVDIALFFMQEEVMWKLSLSM